MRTETSDPIRGKTLLFTFEDGPMTGKTFEHTFKPDGTVTYHALGGDDEKAPPARPIKYELERVNDDVYAVSYLGDGGYTLTSVLDFKSGHITGFASNEKSLVVQHGNFAAAKPRPS